MDELIKQSLEDQILPDWLANPKTIKPEEIDINDTALMDTAILKANTYFQKKYWPPKLIDTPLKGNRVITHSDGPPVELFWTPSRHHSHTNLGYAIVWGYDVRNLHYGADYPSPAYSLYHGPISKFIYDYSENPEKLDDWVKYILEEIKIPEYVHERNSDEF